MTARPGSWHWMLKQWYNARKPLTRGALFGQSGWKQGVISLRLIPLALATFGGFPSLRYGRGEAVRQERSECRLRLCFTLRRGAPGVCAGPPGPTQTDNEETPNDRKKEG